MVLFLSGGVLLLRRLRSRHQRILVQQKWELEVAQQHEMDEAKIRFFTNISHDLRTPLSLIITPLEKLIHSEKPVQVQGRFGLDVSKCFYSA